MEVRTFLLVIDALEDNVSCQPCFFWFFFPSKICVTWQDLNLGASNLLSNYVINCCFANDDCSDPLQMVWKAPLNLWTVLLRLAWLLVSVIALSPIFTYHQVTFFLYSLCKFIPALWLTTSRRNIILCWTQTLVHFSWRVHCSLVSFFLCWERIFKALFIRLFC